MLHVAFVVSGVVACILAIQGAIIVGYTRSLADEPKHNLSLIDRAVRLSADDPELYFVRAKYAATHGDIAEAIVNLQQALVLRPRDYRLWVQLGGLLEKNARHDAAFEAFSKAEALAPFYATPHWEKAKLFQKRGQNNEAFAEYRKAALANPALFESVIEIAWETHAPDVEKIEAALDPQSDSEKLVFARFLIYHDKALQALPVIQSVADLSVYDRRQLLRYLIGRREFTVAYALWIDAPWNTDLNSVPYSIPDGGFESGRISDDAGFAWTGGRAAATSISIDDRIHLNGKRSLRIEWTGGAAPSEDVISLLVPVEPDASYLLRFAARSRDVISGAAPIITISDVSKGAGGATRRSVELPVGTGDWQQLRLAFKTGPATNTIRISVQKQGCKDAVCPIFGTHWLDDFVLSRIAVS